jgi:hypothetical protein
MRVGALCFRDSPTAPIRVNPYPFVLTFVGFVHTAAAYLVTSIKPK